MVRRRHARATRLPWNRRANTIRTPRRSGRRRSAADAHPGSHPFGGLSMPPPLPSQQGSRAGLITTLVIFIIFFLVSTVFWITTTQKLTKAELDLKNMQTRYKDVIAEGDLSTDAAYLDAIKAKSGDASTAFKVVVQQRNDLSKAITGAEMPAQDARQTGEGALK